MPLLLLHLLAQTALPAAPALVGPPSPWRLQALVSQTPAAMVRAMLDFDLALIGSPGATVEVIGQDEAVALNRISLHLMEQVRLQYRPIYTPGNLALRSVMVQDPNRPAGVQMPPPALPLP